MSVSYFAFVNSDTTLATLPCIAAARTPQCKGIVTRENLGTLWCLFGDYGLKLDKHEAIVNPVLTPAGIMLGTLAVCRGDCVFRSAE
jgi:hypothetical protein